MIKGIAVGFLAYGVFACGDAAVKALGGSLPIFEIAFFSALFALIAVPFVKASDERWRDLLSMHRPVLVLVRAASGTIAGILGVVAFTTLPFAEAYALIFLTPLFITVLSAVLLGERVGALRAFAMLVGLAGVLLVIRPGFRELLPGHFAAIGVAVCAATTVLVLRVLGPTEKRITLMGMAMLVALAVNGALMAFEFEVPSGIDLVWLVLAGLLAGAGHILLMAATRAAPANRIAPAQYSQIIWAVVLGAIFFREFPDAVAVAGMALVAVSGIFAFLQERQAGQPARSALTILWGRTPRGGGRG
jgi:S-adenosylmethionine uptake transporter